MSKVLVVDSSLNGEASVSKRLTAEVVSRLRQADPATQVVVRDLGRNPVPHLTGEAFASFLGAGEETEAKARARTLSDELIGELRAADVVVIGAPMYNFGVPSTLKAWFDHVLRAGVTFRYTEKGAEGLLKGRRAIVVESRGGIYSEGPAKAMDAQEPHLRTLLGFVGITDVTVIRAEGLAMGTERRTGAIAAAVAEVKGLVPDTALAA